MNKIVKKIALIISVIIFITIINANNVKGATFSISSSTSTVEPGESFRVILKSNGAGFVDLSCSNGSLSSKRVWVEGSETITCTAGSTEGKITISASGVIADFDTGEDEKKSGSTSVTIKKKEETKTENNNNTQNKNNTNKNNTTKTTTTKTETKKQEEIKIEEDDFYLNSITLKGIQENNEQVDVLLSPEFNKNTFEYSCTLSSDINKIELRKRCRKI